jgi:RNA polymerase sigma factor (sigma-70 family)
VRDLKQSQDFSWDAYQPGEDNDDAFDVYQNTFEQVWQTTGIENLKAYFRRSLRNGWVRHNRQQRRRLRIERSWESFEQSASGSAAQPRPRMPRQLTSYDRETERLQWEADQAHSAWRRQITAALHKAVLRVLTPYEQQVYKLYICQEWSAEQVAQRLETSPGAIRQTAVRLRDKLTQALRRA